MPIALSADPSEAARRQAQQILSERRFHESGVPRPFHGVLEAVGRGATWIGDKLAWPFRQLGVRGPEAGGGWAWLWVLLALAVVVLAVVIATRLGRRRGGLRIEAGTARSQARGREDPAQLERAAEQAERAGDLAGALRLRFRAGLLRLARARVIPARSSVTTREVRAAVASPEFDELARAFDEVVYGHRDARPDDLERARTGWRRVLESAGT